MQTIQIWKKSSHKTIESDRPEQVQPLLPKYFLIDMSIRIIEMSRIRKKEVEFWPIQWWTSLSLAKHFPFHPLYLSKFFIDNWIKNCAMNRKLTSNDLSMQRPKIISCKIIEILYTFTPACALCVYLYACVRVSEFVDLLRLIRLLSRTASPRHYEVCERQFFFFSFL